MNVACYFCGEPVDPLAADNWRRVQGWERKAQAASRKSGSDIALREPLDDYAHNICLKLEKDGIGVGQTGFFDDGRPA